MTERNSVNEFRSRCFELAVMDTIGIDQGRFDHPFNLFSHDRVLPVQPHWFSELHADEAKTDKIEIVINQTFDLLLVGNAGDYVRDRIVLVTKNGNFAVRFNFDSSNPGFSHELNCKDPRSSA
jgi:hypothetical protein